MCGRKHNVELLYFSTNFSTKNHRFLSSFSSNWFFYIIFHNVEVSVGVSSSVGSVFFFCLLSCIHFLHHCSKRHHRQALLQWFQPKRFLYCIPDAFLRQIGQRNSSREKRPLKQVSATHFKRCRNGRMPAYLMWQIRIPTTKMYM